MAEGTLASAVALPEQDTLPPSPDTGLKRRNSVTEADPDTKRRRLSSQHEDNDDRTAAEPAQTSPGVTDRKPERKPGRQAGGREEERKRGQRLFGALLGTLSQRSNPAAQKRRADIERRQQDKLKLQDEEYGELKKKKREERSVIRKKEQRLYEEEAMRTRHANILAMAHFLKTKAEPALYYKPWQLRSDDEDIIQDQVEEAKATISREISEFESRYPPEEEESTKESNDDNKEEKHDQAPAPEADTQELKEISQETSDPVGAETNHVRGSEVARTDITPTNDNNVSMDNDHADVHRGAEDDGGEVVEDKEDTVIY
ncbi:pinin/SDK/memA/ protein conserved region-domain-containing protein [Aspergillus avenaceus]|uniref:Pinin/SDK/memA/ protein conserved region-domain-containing protein n=1 Tax=Aspergillus avenaceus TaxID=36643 RepID=A0A5N6U818_ASPAV|nr:pinin/SDK/memA/ protein conserved region-domain-containing protein [Aspergillus avenaceus]